MADQLRQGDFLLPVVTQANDPSIWVRGPQTAFSGWIQNLDAWMRNQLVGSLDAFAKGAHLSEFFVAAVIVAIIGNAAEHGSAVLLAARGQLQLAAEIALASSAQVAGLLIPAVALLSWAIEPLSLGFRAVEMLGIGGAALAAGVLGHPPPGERDLLGAERAGQHPHLAGVVAEDVLGVLPLDDRVVGHAATLTPLEESRQWRRPRPSSSSIT